MLEGSLQDGVECGQHDQRDQQAASSLPFDSSRRYRCRSTIRVGLDLHQQVLFPLLSGSMRSCQKAAIAYPLKQQTNVDVQHTRVTKSGVLVDDSIAVESISNDDDVKELPHVDTAA